MTPWERSQCCTGGGSLERNKHRHSDKSSEFPAFNLLPCSNKMSYELGLGADAALHSIGITLALCGG